jgi:nitrogen fixation protein NifQ
VSAGMATSDDTLPRLVELITGPLGAEARFAAEIDERRVEFDALVEMLERDATPGPEPGHVSPVARAVAAGCLGDQHLWRDLQLPSRGDLRRLLEAYFEPMAADNVMDMRWKKFIYRRLCRWGGFATCKSPSCGVCPDYADCFPT